MRCCIISTLLMVSFGTLRPAWVSAQTALSVPSGSIINVEVKPKGAGSWISWTASLSDSVVAFRVERSEDLRQWLPIAILSVKTSEHVGLRDYGVLDSRAVGERVYYRIQLLRPSGEWEAADPAIHPRHSPGSILAVSNPSQ